MNNNVFRNISPITSSSTQAYTQLSAPPPASHVHLIPPSSASPPASLLQPHASVAPASAVMPAPLPAMPLYDNSLHLQQHGNTNIPLSYALDASAPSSIRPGTILRYFQPVKTLKRKASSLTDPPAYLPPHPSAPFLPDTSTSPSTAIDHIHGFTDMSIAAAATVSSSFSDLPIQVSPLPSDASLDPVLVAASTSHQHLPHQPSIRKKTRSAPHHPPRATRSSSSSRKPAPSTFVPSHPTSTLSFTTPHLTWARRNNTLLITTTTSPPPLLHPDYTSGSKKIAIAAFDLDSTIVKTQSQTPFPKDGADWMWFNSFVRGNMQALVKHQLINKSRRHTAPYDLLSQEAVSPVFRRFLAESNPENIPYFVAIITNQGGVIIKEDTKRYGHFKERLDRIAAAMDIPFWCYSATRAPAVKKQLQQPKSSKQQSSPQPQPPPPRRAPAAPAKEKDLYRKPECGMWHELMADVGRMGLKVDHSRSFYVGDAAGRKNDFSDSDREFAKALHLKFFTPEEFFINDNFSVNKSTKI